MGLPGLPFTVIDANQLRIEKTVSDLVAEYRATGQRTALPWVHLYEQTKGGDAAGFDRVHEHLRAEPRAFFIARPTFVLHALERRAGRPIRGVRRIEDRIETVAFRKYLRDPRATADISALQAAVAGVFRRLNVPGWTKLLQDGIRFDTQDEEKRIRKALAEGDRAPLCRATAEFARLGRLERTMGGLFSVNGGSWRRAERLASYASMSALTILTYVHVGSRRRLQTPKKEPEDNPAADIEAILLALFGRRLVTADTFARETDEDMRRIAREAWP
jgi:hypothetical protein